MKKSLSTVSELLPTLHNYIAGDVLDMGGGAGQYRKFIETKARSYLISDLYSSNADFHDDAKNLSNKNDSFDTIICTEVLEHIDDVSKVIDEMYRVLKRGGYGIITTPFMFPIHGNPSDYYRFTPKGLEFIFGKAKFEVIQSGTIGGLSSTLAKVFKTKSKEYVRGRNNLKKLLFCRLFNLTHQILISFQHYLSPDVFFTHSYIIVRK